tara:strand:- start:6932 stop:7363 length:432 start_codon:yes stop_codon:yes gene_type:complete
MAYSGTLTGNLGRDPKVRYFEDGKQVADFSVAVRQWKRDAPAHWVKVTVWGKSVAYIADNLKKGDKVVCFGRVENGEVYNDQVINKFTASDVEKFYDKKPDTVASTEACPMPTQRPAVNSAAPENKVNWASSTVVPDSDEIPF